MAINPETSFPGKITASSAEYPFGKARNITTPGDGTGTPWDEKILNDIFGFQQALLSGAGLVPTGGPDEVGASQYLDALRKIGVSTFDTTVIMTGLLKSELFPNQRVIIKDYRDVGDGGGGEFFFDSISTETANGGTVFITDEGGTGRWKRIINGSVVDIRMFGAAGDYNLGTKTGTDDTAAIQAAHDYIESIYSEDIFQFPIVPTLRYPKGIYKVSASLTLIRPVNLDAAAATLVVATTFVGRVFDWHFDADGGTDSILWDITAHTPRIIKEEDGAGLASWTEDATGLYIENMRHANLDVGQIFGFQKGFHVVGKGTGFTGNEIHLRRIRNCKISLFGEAIIGGAVQGWITDNLWVAGKLELASGQPAVTTGARFIDLQHPAVTDPLQFLDKNIFMKTVMESNNQDVKIVIGGTQNMFYMPRLEGLADDAFEFVSGSRRNAILYAEAFNTDPVFSDNGIENIFLNWDNVEFMNPGAPSQAVKLFYNTFSADSEIAVGATLNWQAVSLWSPTETISVGDLRRVTANVNVLEASVGGTTGTVEPTGAGVDGSVTWILRGTTQDAEVGFTNDGRIKNPKVGATLGWNTTLTVPDWGAGTSFGFSSGHYRFETRSVTGLTGRTMYQDSTTDALSFRTPEGLQAHVGLKVPVPSTGTSPGRQGEWAADSSFLYTCTATNVWRRVAHAAF